MGCVYACVCSCNCLRCGQYEPERYFGHAEDVFAQSKGYPSDSEYRKAKREEEEYYKEMEEYYFKQEYENAMKEENINAFCRERGCENYIEWNCGYGDCISCKLQGQSYNIEKIAEDCPFKNEYNSK